MYSGTTLNSKSGALVGTHQRINRIAFKTLQKSMSVRHFPQLKQIQYFEGNNGPDGIKRKSPDRDEPNHFCNPANKNDRQIHAVIQGHYNSLVEHLRLKNLEKAAFEASWLAHSIVDGLTPAHHFPYKEAVTELRGGRENFDSLSEKMIFRGSHAGHTLLKNWKFWGPKGLLLTHSLFEWGVGMIALLSQDVKPVTKQDLKRLRNSNVADYYEERLTEVAKLNMFQSFHRYGWTFKLAKQVEKDLLPQLVNTVTVMWAQALHESGLAGKVKT